MTERERVLWARTLTTAGWLITTAYLALVTAQVRRAAAISQGSFDDGVWGQRLETVSFIAFPQNMVILTPATGAAAVATVISVGLVDRVEIWLAQLTRVLAGVCYVVIVLAALRMLALFWQGPDLVGDFGALLTQLGGILIALAISRVCLEAEHSADEIPRRST